jgi:hypothetical protein
MTDRVKAWLLENPAVVIFLVVQSVALVIWGTRMDARLTAIEQFGSPAMINMQARIAVIETRQQNVISVLGENGRKMDGVTDLLQRHLAIPRENPRQ